MEWFPLARWLLATAILAAAGAPVAAWLLRPLPDRGGSFALHVSLIVILVVTFWVGHLRYGWLALVAALVVLGGLSGLALHRDHRPDWPAVVWGYAVFLLGFLGAIVVRVTNNTIGPAGGEQFLHYGLLRAVGRATRFPPEDMWFAGESVRYYYGGHALVDQVARLAFVEPRFAYTLGFALIFGLAVAGAYGLVGALAERMGRDRHVGGALGVFFLVLAGNLATAVRLLFGHLPESIALRYGGFAFAAIRQDWTLEEALAEQGSLTNWFWWHDRYVVPDTLQEFPMYSLLKADLHGHVTTIPFTVLIAAVAYAYVRTPTEARWRRRLLAFGALPALAGAVGWMNTWSLPGAVGIAWLALALAPAHPLRLGPRSIDATVDRIEGMARPVAEAARLASATVLAVVIGVASVAWIAPFVLFQLPPNDGIGFFPSRSPVSTQLLIWGGFLALFALYVVLVTWDGHREDDTERVALGLIGGGGLAALVLVALGVGSLAIGLPVIALAWWLVRTERYDLGFVGILLIGGIGLVLSMELVYAEVWPPHRERWNTTYKVSMQAWILCALAAGAVATALIGDASDRLRTTVSMRPLAGGGVVLLIVLAMAAFPAMAIGHEVGGYAVDDHRYGHSIDGLDGLDRWRADEMAAIHWLDERAGTPTVLEAPGRPAYSWVSPASTLTGLPTVAGWEHVRGYHGVEAYETRVELVDEMYTGERATAIALLHEFEVDYIYVGPNEVDRYGTDRIEFASIEGIEVVHETPDVTIYRVDHDRLPG